MNNITEDSFGSKDEFFLYESIILFIERINVFIDSPLHNVMYRNKELLEETIHLYLDGGNPRYILLYIGDNIDSSIVVFNLINGEYAADKEAIVYVYDNIDVIEL